MSNLRNIKSLEKTEEGCGRRRKRLILDIYMLQAIEQHAIYKKSKLENSLLNI